MIAENGLEAEPKGWRQFLKKHWKVVALFSTVGVSLLVGAILVFLWFLENAQSTNLVPATLNLWTMANMVSFTLHAIFWEILLVGIPAIVVGVAAWLWWRRLPEEEKKEYHFSNSHSRSKNQGGGGAISILVAIAFLIKIYNDGNWNVPVATWTLDYLAYSVIWTAIWIVVIFGIPAVVIGIVWWIAQGKKKPESGSST